MPSSQPSHIATTAKAFATYSLVPYIGILFCPGAVLVGSFGIVRSFKANGGLDGPSRVVCYLSVIAGIIILVIQLLLWWILYKVPEWARGL